MLKGSIWRRLAPLLLSFVFGFAHAAPTVTVFTATTDSGTPQRLVTGPDGLLYFASDKGVFRLTASGASIVASMPSAPSQLIAGYDGNFYGAVSGTTFRMRPDGALTTLAQVALGNLVFKSDGNLYGTQSNGGVYRLTASGTLTKLSDAYIDNMAEGLGGNLFGVVWIIDPPYYTYQWTNYVYKVTPGGAASQTDTFACTDGMPNARLTSTPAGLLYGVTEGALNDPFDPTACHGPGVLFSIDSSGKYTNLARFTGASGGSSAPLLYAADGTLFGVSDFYCNDYPNDCHVPALFRYRPAKNPSLFAGDLTMIGGDVAQGRALAQTADGTIYGIAGSTIYRLKRPTTLHGEGSFSVNPSTGAVTINPKAVLTDDMTTRGIAGQTIRFYRKGVQICVVQTDVSGAASCKVAAKDHTSGFDAIFQETNLHAASKVTSPLVCVVGTNCK